MVTEHDFKIRAAVAKTEIIKRLPSRTNSTRKLHLHRPLYVTLASIVVALLHYMLLEKNQTLTDGKQEWNFNHRYSTAVLVTTSSSHQCLIMLDNARTHWGVQGVPIIADMADEADGNQLVKSAPHFRHIPVHNENSKPGDNTPLHQQVNCLSSTYIKLHSTTQKCCILYTFQTPTLFVHFLNIQKELGPAVYCHWESLAVFLA